MQLKRLIASLAIFAVVLQTAPTFTQVSIVPRAEASSPGWSPYYKMYAYGQCPSGLGFSGGTMTYNSTGGVQIKFTMNPTTASYFMQDAVATGNANLMVRYGVLSSGQPLEWNGGPVANLNNLSDGSIEVTYNSATPPPTSYSDNWNTYQVGQYTAGIAGMYSYNNIGAAGPCVNTPLTVVPYTPPTPPTSGTTQGSVSSSSECLASSNGFAINKITPMPAGQYQVEMNLSNAILNSTAWRNAEYDFYVTKDAGWSLEDGPNVFRSVRPTISGNTATVTLNNIPESDSGYWDTNSRKYFEPAIYLGVVNSYAKYSTSGGTSTACSGFKRAKKIPTTKAFSFEDVTGALYSILIEDVNNDDTRVRATLLTPANKTVTINGSTLSPNTPVELAGIGENHVFTATTPDDTFGYNFIRPNYGDDRGSLELSLDYSARPDPNTVDFFFKKRRLSTANGTNYRGSPYTHYRTISTSGVRSNWVAITPNTSGSYNETLLYSIPSPAAVAQVEFTRNASVFTTYSNYAGSNNYNVTYAVNNQIDNIQDYSVPPRADALEPIVFGILIDGERNGFVRTPTVTARPLAIDDIGITSCLAGYSAASVTQTLASCTAFTWNLFEDATTDGPATLYFKARDAAGKESVVFSKSVNVDGQAPTINETTAIQNMAWRNTPYQVALTATDNTGGSGVYTTKYSLFDTQPANCSLTDTTYLQPFDVAVRKFICAYTEDNAGNPQAFGPFEIKIDTDRPTVTGSVEAAAGRTVAYNQNTGRYLTNDPRFTLALNAADTLSGIQDLSCRIARDNVSLGVGCDANNILRYTQAADLVDGEYTFTMNAADNAGNGSNTQTIRVIVDTSAPTAPAPGTIAPTPGSNPGTTGNSITFTLPTFTDNPNGTGIDRVEVALTQNGQPFTVLPTMLGGNDPRITIENGIIIIRPDANGQMPTTLELINLPATVDINGQTVQAEYQATFTIYDRSGNPTVVPTDPVRFDTAAPTITGIAPAAGSVQGDGLSANTAYRVGSDLSLPLVFSLEETSNSTSGNSSLPLTIQVVGNGVTLANGQVNSGCATLQNNACTLPVAYAVDAGFVGSLSFTVTDSAGNISAQVTRFIEQSNGTPTIPNTDPTAPNGDIAVLPSLANRFNGGLLQVSLQNVAMNGSTQLNARFGYTTTNNTQNEVLGTVTPGQNANSYVLSFALPNTGSPTAMREGTQNATLILSNEYGNESAPITLPINRDTIAPAVTNFRYSWNEDTNRATVQWDNITEASGTVNLEYRVNLEGNTGNWASTAVTAGQTSFEIPLDIAADDATIDIRFNDGSVYALTPQGAEVLNPNQTLLQVARKDVVLNFNTDPATESLIVSFATAAGVDVSTIQSLVTTLTRPDGGTQTSNIPPVPANNILFTLAQPRVGMYQALSELVFTGGNLGTLSFSKSAPVIDIVAPRGSLALTTGGNVMFTNNTYYVSQDNNVELVYGINGALEQSYPVTVTGTVTLNGNTTAIAGLTDLSAITLSNNLSLSTVQDGTYTVSVTFTDGVSLSNTQAITIVKDSSIQIVSTRVLMPDDQEITARDSGNNVYTQTRSGLKLELTINNEPGALQYFINNQEITNSEVVAGAPANQTIVRLPIADLADNTLNTLDLRVVDAAANEGLRTIPVRVDNNGPAITGTISFPAQSNTNAIILNGVTVTDFSPVRYRVTTGAGNTEGLFNNSIPLPEGTSTFTLAFLDSLGNPASVNNGQSFTVFVDSQGPTATASISPTQTRDRTAQITLTNITDTSDQISYEVATGNTILTTGTIQRANYASTQIDLDLTPIINTNTTLVVRLTDTVGHTSPFNLSIVQDERGPDVVFGATSTINGGIGIGWPLTITDALSNVQTVTGTIRNLTTGETFSIANADWQTGANGSYIGAILPPNVRAGNVYVLTVTATDSLTNPTTNASSLPFTMPTAPTEEENPLNEGPVLDPTITGTTIDVRVTNNNGGIDFTVNDLPRGTQVILDYVLDQYNIQNPNNQIPILPIGNYTITITDDLGNTQTAAHTVTPYYFSTAADLNGDGFGGGITDHRLFDDAQTAGLYDMNIPTVATAVNTITTVITDRMNNEFSRFLSEV